MANTDGTITTEQRALNIIKRVGGVVTPVVPPGTVTPKEAAAPVDPIPAVVNNTIPDESKTYDFGDTTPNDPVAPTVATPAPVEKELSDDALESLTDDAAKLADPQAYNSKGFKALRAKLDEEKKARKKEQEELGVLRKKTKDYEDGLAVPEITQKQADRIAYLEKYEHLYNLKESPVYQEKYAKPIREEQAKLLTLATEYEVPIETLNAAFAAESSADTNRILSSAFKDDVGAIEAKSIFKEIKKVQAAAAEAEKEPAVAFARMQQENSQIVAKEKQRSQEAVVHTSKESWSESLAELREDNRFPEITFREGDTEHNETYVRPILTRAAQEYGRMVRGLVQEGGLKQMPKEIGKAMAKMNQYAHQAVAIAVERDALRTEVAELRQALESRGYNRPGVTGSGTASGGGGGNSTPATAEERGMRLLNRVSSKA